MRITAIRGDLTKVDTDAIVNAANRWLRGGGGVDGAIHRAGGPEIAKACEKIIASKGEVHTGDAVITTAGNLPNKFIIHAVGPIWKGGRNNEQEKLENCYTNSLILAEKHHCKSIAFSSISTGIYGYPKDLAAEVAVRTVKNFPNKHNVIEEVIFVCFKEEDFRHINAELEKSSM